MHGLGEALVLQMRSLGMSQDTALQDASTDKTQLSRQEYHEQILLLYVAVRLGFLPDRPRLHCLRILHLSACTLQSSRIRNLGLHHYVRSVLVHSRSCPHDVSLDTLHLHPIKAL
jgi:hypothetical protein